MLLALALLGCATWRYPGPLGQLGEPAELTAAARIAQLQPDRPKSRPTATGLAVAEAAEAFLGNRTLRVNGETYRFDCSGLVEASLAKAGVQAAGSTADLYAAAETAGALHRRRLPRPGDIVFFDNTYDRNKNGAVDDPLSHSAVVQSVAKNGTVTMVHVGSKGVVQLRMNLQHPSLRSSSEGEVLNDPLRSRGRSDPEGTLTLSGELWVAFADPEKL